MSLRPVVFSGPSGSGKSALLDLLIKKYPTAFSFSISHTTRKPRPGEEHGKHYYFTTVEQMEGEIKEGKFVEYTRFSGNLYGTSKRALNDVLNSNRICLLDIEEHGVRSIKKTDLHPLYVFIGPPSLETLRQRLKLRGTETSETIEHRMATAASAVKYSKTPGAYDIVITNDNLERAFKELQTFLLKDYSDKMQECAAESSKDTVATESLTQNGHINPSQDSKDNKADRSLSINEISLSPVRLQSSALEDPPAIVATESIDAGSDSPVITRESSTKSNSLIITDRSSAMLEINPGSDEASAVCGRNGWCAIS